MLTTTGVYSWRFAGDRKGSYLFLLAVAASLLVIVLLDATKPRKSEHHSRIIDSVLVVWLPLSVEISISLLHWCKTQTQIPSTRLPRWVARNARERDSNTTTTESLEQYDTLLAFGHFWLTLSLFLGVICNSSNIESSPGNNWAPVGLQFTLFLVVAFGRCLLIRGINKNQWGYFLLLYLPITFPFELIGYVFHRISESLEEGEQGVAIFRRRGT